MVDRQGHAQRRKAQVAVVRPDNSPRPKVKYQWRDGSGKQAISKRGESHERSEYVTQTAREPINYQITPREGNRESEVAS